MFQFLTQRLNKLLPLLKAHQLAVAVSGGADSMALCLALNEWGKSRGLKLTALTVDHQLRPESTLEANQVHQWLSAYGIHHEILVWHHDSISSNIQEHARDARYKLLIEYCTHHHIHNLFLGHHLHDQWETFLMRLTHGSGLKGLSSMSHVASRQGINIFRPFLTVNPQQLKNYLLSQNQPWIDDPSNQSETYERIRWRNQLMSLSKFGLTPQVIARTCEKLFLEDEALNWSAMNWIQHNTTFNPQLKFIQSNINLKHLPESLIKRVALRIASRVRGIEITSKNVRHNMNALYHKLLLTPLKPFTFAGCYWMEYQKSLYIMREWDKCPTEVIPAPEHVYDHRFTLTGLPVGETFIPIGKEHWPKIKPIFRSSSLPYQVFLSLPIIIKEDKIIWCKEEELLEGFKQPVAPRHV